ncbi:Ribonuclease Y [Geodia barretti]|uniref:Ribonuclease Y n=3 Tax=Geodia barretti TaxID=519541 RepID=A0AA35X4E3_GEOBA|nr:Ribonuclease Y [Geodia barretti]
MEIAIFSILAVLIGLSIGALGGYFGRGLLQKKSYAAAQSEAAQILEDVADERRAIIIEGKEEALKFRTDAEAEIRERRSEVQRTEQRIANRQENVERRATNLERRERKLSDKEKTVSELEHSLTELKAKKLTKLEEIGQLSMSDARNELMYSAEQEIEHDLAIRYRDFEEQARAEANEKARNILALAIHRFAADVVSEATVTTVQLPSDDMKGRLIGREGRNIRAIEKATGVDLIIDDTPEAVTLSCFDPVRREIARLAVTNLVSDGRIHPARIEEMVGRSEKEVSELIWKSGEEAALEVGVRGLHPDIVRLLGRLKYRYSYGENVLQHSIEVAHLSSMIASEVGANVKVAMAGGLLHDLGKALSHEVEGPHAEIGADIASKHSVAKAVCTCIAEHHDDVMSSTEAFIVSAADAISAARPGSRRDTAENYIKRLQAWKKSGAHLTAWRSATLFRRAAKCA